MKKIMLALLAVTSITAANAQKNSFLLYGTVGVHTSNDDMGAGLEGKSLNWHIMPGFGYQFHKNLTVGVQGGYMYNRTRDVDTLVTLQDDISSWTVGPFFRYTHSFSPIFSFWSQLDLGYVAGTHNQDVPSAPKVTTVTDDFNGFRAAITPALSINVHNGLALNFGIGGISYETISWDKSPLSTNGFNFTFGEQINVGISKNFARRSNKAPKEPGMDSRMHDHDDEEE